MLGRRHIQQEYAQDGKTIESYRNVEHRGHSFGARLVDNQSGLEEYYSDGHTTRDEATQWLLIALGWFGMIILISLLVIILLS